MVSLALLVIPQYYFISMSFHANLGYGKIGEIFTFENYARIFTDILYISTLLRTAGLAAATAFLALIFGFPVAYFLARSNSRWISILVGLLIAATFITPVVKDLGLIILLSKNGPVNVILGLIGAISEPIQWLGASAGVIIGLLHYTLPLMVLMLLTVIQTVPRSLEEAAHAHGASRLRVYYAVVIPIVKPGLVAAALMVFNLTMGAFTTPALLGGGRILTFPILVQRAVILDVDYPFAAALSGVLLVFVFGLNLLGGHLMLKQTKIRSTKKRKTNVVTTQPAMEGA